MKLKLLRGFWMHLSAGLFTFALLSFRLVCLGLEASTVINGNLITAWVDSWSYFRI